MKQILSCLLALSLCFTMGIMAFADTADKNKDKPIQNTIPPTASESFVVMDAETGQVLIEKNMDKKLYPASITKILTAAMALEYGDVRDQYEITEEDVFSYKFPGTTYVALTHGEVVTVEQLLYGTLMASANDAANCLGSYVALKTNQPEIGEDGSASYVKGFVNMMNKKLKEIGAVNTHFTNAHGLPDEKHVTTAYDMALITKYALGVKDFRTYFEAESYVMAPTNKQPEPRKWGTQSGIFSPSNKYYFEGATGAKMGYTEEAGHTMVSVAKRDGRELICVVLGCRPGDWTDHRDTINLYNYCFNNFDIVTFTTEELKQRAVPVYKDGVISEKARIAPKEDYRLHLHKMLRKDDVRFSSNAPGRYYAGDEMRPSLAFALTKAAEKKASGAMYTQLSTLPLKVDVVSLVDEKDKKDFDWETLKALILDTAKNAGLFLLGLAVVILLLRIYNIRKYRKLAAKKRRMQQRRMQNRR